MSAQATPPRLTLSFLDAVSRQMPRLSLRTVALRTVGLPEQLLTFAFADPYERREAAEIWSSARHLPLQRMGSWSRYRDELALAWVIVTGLGWTLSDDEQALLGSLAARATHGE